MPTPPALPRTVYELIIAVIGCFIFSLLSKAARWVNDRTAAFDNKGVAKELEAMVRLGPNYPDLMLRKMREALCGTAYCLCCGFFLYAAGWPGMRLLICLLTIAAAYLTTKAMGHAVASTSEGSEIRKARYRKRLGIVDEATATIRSDI